MCYSVVLASDHPFPIIPLVMDQRGFNAEPLPPENPLNQWLSKPHRVNIGSHTWCACGLDFHVDELLEGPEPAEFTDDYPRETWLREHEEYLLGKKVMKDYFHYLRQMAALGDLEWYCAWEDSLDKPPQFRFQKSRQELDGEPTFKQDYVLRSGVWMVYRD